MRDDCKSSCIDLIITDQPNIVLESGTRHSLDPYVKHEIVFCKLNFKIPPLPKYVRKLWHFKRAETDLIRRAIVEFPLGDFKSGLIIVNLGLASLRPTLVSRLITKHPRVNYKIKINIFLLFRED